MSRYKTSLRQRWRMDIQGWLLGIAYPGHYTGRILDLGMEYGHTGRKIRSIYPKAYLVGVDCHEPTLSAAKQDCKRIYNEYHLMDAVDYLQQCNIRWGAIVAAEIIEHLDKERGKLLLSMLKEKTDLAIVTSPIGFAAQGPIENNPYQEHISGWEPEEMKSLGWRIFSLMPEGYGLAVYFHDKLNLLK